MMRRLFLATASALALAITLSGCAGPQIADFAGQQPTLDLRRYFDGVLDAHGIFTDRAGKVVKRFSVVMYCRWSGDEGVLDERFTYSDGSQQTRVWHLRKDADGRYTGRADDVTGDAAGEARGNAFRWRYTLQLPVDGKVVGVQFDDWMYLMNDQVMLNRAAMSKWGVHLGDVTLTFIKR